MEATLKELTTSLAKEYAESLIHQTDLQNSLAAMRLWSEKYANQRDGDAAIIGPSLFRDAIVLFVGCFDEAAKAALSAEEIYGHDPNGLTSFQWFKDQRDCFAAHKFGAQRQCIPGVIQDPTTGLAIDIGSLNARYRGQNKEDGPQLIGFIQAAATHVDQKVQSLFASLMEEARKMTKEQIDALNVAKVRTLDQQETRISRAALQKSFATGQPPKRNRR